MIHYVIIYDEVERCYGPRLQVPVGDRSHEMTVVRLSPMQRQLAKVMRQSSSEAPQCTIFGDVDVTSLTSLREKLKAKGPAPTVSHFVLVALARTLLEHPRFNAHLDGDMVTEHETVNISLAVSLKSGELLAPVLHDVAQWDAFTMAAHARDLSGRAYRASLSSADMQGGTFMFSSLGQATVSRYATPILILPQVAVLAATRIRTEPVVHGSEISVADMLPVSLTFDHRAINGQQANNFLDTLSVHLADPEALLLPLQRNETP
jgi:pyruvate/2-oxoglutarate dehydrogenase complex dihydrolipoamide acyltransferase (E2) component